MLCKERNQQMVVSRRATPVARECNPTALRVPTRRHAHPSSSAILP